MFNNPIQIYENNNNFTALKKTYFLFVSGIKAEVNMQARPTESRDSSQSGKVSCYESEFCNSLPVLYSDLASVFRATEGRIRHFRGICVSLQPAGTRSVPTLKEYHKWYRYRIEIFLNTSCT